MAPKKTSKGAKSSSSGSASSGALEPPKPFRIAPEGLKPFTSSLSKKHVYIAHVDQKPASFKRKIFSVPVLLNAFVFALFLWRMWYIVPYYVELLSSSFLGYENSTTIRLADLTWTQFIKVAGRRTLTFFFDFLLAVFVWPWPIEFVFGRKHGSPVSWRMAVGFRDKEIYVRRSRSWDTQVYETDIFSEKTQGNEARALLWGMVRNATSPMLLQEKTGYLTMNGDWDLDWKAMVKATALVDKKEIPLDAFRTLVLCHHDKFGWIAIDMNASGENAQEDERRRQVFAFRDALAAIGKENLFYRWIEVIQFETQQGGFTQERQLEVAQKIRDLFKENGVDFDQFWKEAVGSDPSVGI